MSADKLNVRDIMWIDPVVARSIMDSLSDEDTEMVLKVTESWARGLERSFDALLGKDAHVMVRVALVAAYSTHHQKAILEEFGFAVDDNGVPEGFLDEDEHIGADQVDSEGDNANTEESGD